MRARTGGAGLLCLLMGSAMAPTAVAQTTHTVNLTGFSFEPSDITVTVGDTVQWVWLDGIHNVESGVGGVFDGKFRSGDPVSGGTYSLVVDQAFLDANPAAGDVYPYYCLPHWSLGMVGSITVTAPVPTVSQWGLIAMALIMLAAGTVAVGRCRAKPTVA